MQMSHPGGYRSSYSSGLKGENNSRFLTPECSNMYVNAYEETSVIWIITQEDKRLSAKHLGAQADE